MLARNCMVAFALFAAGLSAHGAEVGGVKVDDRVYIAQGLPELELNGAGVRRKLMTRVYVAALYLAKPLDSAEAILQDLGPKRFAMHVVQDEIQAGQFVAALHDGLAANNSSPELAPLEKRIRDLAAMMQEVGRLRQGGTVLLDYLPGIGTRVTVNGVARLTIPGQDFQRALLRIWLGERPVDGRLKRALLSGPPAALPF
jgi:long-chain acyl-CoA synthetase